MTKTELEKRIVNLEHSNALLLNDCRTLNEDYLEAKRHCEMLLFSAGLQDDYCDSGNFEQVAEVCADILALRADAL